MIYQLSIKQNLDRPQEYTDEVEADSLEEASKIFYENLPYEAKEEWNAKSLIRHITEVDEEEYTPEMAEEMRATSKI